MVSCQVLCPLLDEVQHDLQRALRSPAPGAHVGDPAASPHLLHLTCCTSPSTCAPALQVPHSRPPVGGPTVWHGVHTRPFSGGSWRRRNRPCRTWSGAEWSCVQEQALQDLVGRWAQAAFRALRQALHQELQSTAKGATATNTAQYQKPPLSLMTHLPGSLDRPPPRLLVEPAPGRHAHGPLSPGHAKAAEPAAALQAGSPAADMGSARR